MPNKIYLASPVGSNGIAIVWKKKDHTLNFSGWFDSFVGIEGGVLSLREFFDRLNITEKDCKDAFNEESVLLNKVENKTEKKAKKKKILF